MQACTDVTSDFMTQCVCLYIVRHHQIQLVTVSGTVPKKKASLDTMIEMKLLLLKRFLCHHKFLMVIAMLPET